jgi:hypothetical protein
MANVKLLQVRMTEAEYREFGELAKRHNLDMSKLTRLIIRKFKKQDLETGELKPVPENIL